MYTDPTGTISIRKVVLSALYGAISGIVDYWIETVVFDEEFEFDKAMIYAGEGLALGVIDGVIPIDVEDVELSWIVAKSFFTLIAGIVSGDDLRDALISAGYDLIYSFASRRLGEEFNDNEFVDMIAHGIADFIVFGSSDSLEAVTIYLRQYVTGVYKNANNSTDYIVSSPGSARTKVHCER